MRIEIICSFFVIFLGILAIPLAHAQYSGEEYVTDRVDWNGAVERVLLEFVDENLLSNSNILKDTIFTKILGGGENSLPPIFSVIISYDFIENDVIQHLDSKYKVNFGPLATTPENARLEKISESITDTNGCPQGYRQVDIPYAIKGAKLKNLCYETSANSLIASIEGQSEAGFIHLIIPRILLDAKQMNCEDKEFFVLVDGEEREFEEDKLEKFRNIRVSLEYNDTEVEVGVPLQLESARPTMEECQKLILQNYRPYQQFIWALNFTYEELGFYLDTPSKSSTLEQNYDKWQKFALNEFNQPKEVIDPNGKSYQVNYSISQGSKITSLDDDIDAKALILKMASSANGTIFISIPHKLLDVGYFHKCTTSDWVALSDGREIYPLEQKIKQQWRIVEIPFQKDVKEIEIIGSNLLSTSETYGYQCFNKFQNEMNPREQTANGYSLDELICKQDLELIYKNNNSPVCVKPESIPKLVERGWANE